MIQEISRFAANDRDTKLVFNFQL